MKFILTTLFKIVTNSFKQAYLPLSMIYFFYSVSPSKILKFTQVILLIWYLIMLENKLHENKKFVSFVHCYITSM